MWYKMMEIALHAVNGTKNPLTPKGEDEWKVFMRAELPFAVEKTFYECGMEELEPINANGKNVPIQQSDGLFLYHATYLKRRDAVEKEEVIKGGVARGKAQTLLAKLAGGGGNCKY